MFVTLILFNVFFGKATFYLNTKSWSFVEFISVVAANWKFNTLKESWCEYFDQYSIASRLAMMRAARWESESVQKESFLRLQMKLAAFGHICLSDQSQRIISLLVLDEHINYWHFYFLWSALPICSFGLWSHQSTSTFTCWDVFGC